MMKIITHKKIAFLTIVVLILQIVLALESVVYSEDDASEQSLDEVETTPLLNQMSAFNFEEQESNPCFFFSSSSMRGTVEDSMQVTFFSDQEVSEARVFLPEEATLIKEQLSAGISVDQGEQPREWIVKSERAQNTFVLPLVFDTVGSYELSVEETTTIIEISKQEVLKDKELTIDEKLSEDFLDKNDSEKYAQNNIDNSVDARNIVNVSTETQFRNAFNNASVTRINLANNISLSQSLNTLTRDLEINGNGFQFFTGNNHIIMGNNSVIRLTNLVFRTNLPPSNTAILISGSNVQIRLRDFDYRNNQVVFANITPSGSVYSVIFDGGENNLRKLESNLAQELPSIFMNVFSIEIRNNSIVNLTNGVFSFHNGTGTSFDISEGSTFNLNNTFLLGNPIRNLSTLNVEGKVNMNITSASLGTIEKIKIGSTGEFFLNSDWNSGTISNVTNNIEIMRGSIFDINNLAGAAITGGDVNVSIDSTNLALWDLGLQEEEKASIIFSDIHAALFGANASIIGTTTNDRFQKLYDSSGLATYSRISNRPVEEMTRKVIVKHLDTNGNEIADPELINGMLGENYQTRRKQISGYQLIEIPSNESGEFSRETIEVSYIYEVANVAPMDPLYPEIEINPENKPETPENQGQLSIDFASQFNFGSQNISVQDKNYYAQPQQLLNGGGTVNEQEKRPNYVQISDRRSETDRNGWQLSVTQNNQFSTENGKELSGARMRLTNQQLATAHGGTAPSLQQTEPLELVPGAKRVLLMAQGNEGTGTWIYRFGDANTAGNSVVLDVPKGANPEATSYSSTFTWELSAVPEN